VKNYLLCSSFYLINKNPQIQFLQQGGDLRVINCSITAGLVMKPTGLNMDAQR
jgi:hypothetical protein